jgi:selenocysteine lyase/cysteine desulfurase
MNLDRVRAEIPALATCTYLNTAGIGPSPRAVTDTIARLYRQVEADSPDLMARHLEEFTGVEATRGAAASHWSAHPDEIALLRSTAEGFNLIAHGLRWREGDEVISCVQDHPAARAIWAVLARRHGLVVRHFDLFPNDTGERIVARVAALCGPRTRVISLSHVTSENGLLVPAEELAALAHRYGSRLLLDGTQAVGQGRFDLPRIGVDFYAAGFYKWALGPFGTGAMFVRRDRLDEVEPALVGAGGTIRFDRKTGEFEPDPTARRFEFGARPYPLYPAMVEGLRFVEAFGMEEVAARSRQLADHLRAELRGTPGLIDFTPCDDALRTGIVAVALEGMPGDELRDRVREQGFLLRSNRGPAGVTGVRVCCAFFNSEEELTRFAAQVRKAAA